MWVVFLAPSLELAKCLSVRLQRVCGPSEFYAVNTLFDCFGNGFPLVDFQRVGTIEAIRS